MANTFSQSLAGISANARYSAPKVITIGDTDIAGNPVAIGNVSFVGAQQANMKNGNQIICKGPDGALAAYVIDAELSVLPGNIILRRV